MWKQRAIDLANEALPSGDDGARAALTWTLRRVLPSEVEAAAALDLDDGQRVVAALHDGVLYRFSLVEGEAKINYTVSHLSPNGRGVRATVTYKHDPWAGPVSETGWEFDLGKEILRFTSTHPLHARPEGAEVVARLLAEGLGHPVYGQPSDE